MNVKVFYSDHIPYIYRSEEKDYSLLWVNKNFVDTSVYSTLFKNRYGWMIKDGHLYDLKDRYEDCTLGKYKYKQITEAANDLFQGVNDVHETEKIIIVESKYVPDLMRSTKVHHYLPMFDGYAYSFDADGNLECWRIVNEVEVKEHKAPETTLHVEYASRCPIRSALKDEQREMLKSMLQELKFKQEIYGDKSMITCYTAAEADTLTQALKIILENS